MISHTHRCVFIHIPKTAGSSIEYRLGHDITTGRNRQDHRALRHIQPLNARAWLHLVQKGDWDTLYRRIKYRLQGRDFLTPETYRTYFKFTFVRNPWARVYSWYKNVLKDPHHQQELGVPPDCPFDVFVKRHLDCWALRPQLYWICDYADNLTLDFIGRFEHLQRDFRKVAGRIGLEDATLPHLVRGDSSHYMQAYDSVTRDIVARRYAREIAIFGYTFEEG